MKNLKKVAAVLAAAMSLNAVAVTSAFAVSADDTSATVIGSASLKGQMGGYNYWGDADHSDDIVSTPAEITSDGGQYTASWSITGDGTGSIEFLILEFDANSEYFITTDTYPNMKVTVDSVKVDGTDIGYKMTDGVIDAAHYENDKGSTRVYLTDTWGVSPLGKKNVNDIAKDTAVLQSIEVTFTISNLEAADPEPNPTPTPTPGTTTYGDVNGDDVINSADAAAVLMEAARTGAGLDESFTTDTFKAADVNGDGKISSADASLILTYAAQDGAGLDPTPFPAASAAE